MVGYTLHNVYQQTVVAEKFLGGHRRLETDRNGMPFSQVWLHFGRRLDDEAPLSGCPSNGLSQDSKGGEVSLVQAMQDAGGPSIPLPPIHKKVPGRGGAGEAAGGSSNICVSPLAAVFRPWGCFVASGSVQIPGTPACAG